MCLIWFYKVANFTKIVVKNGTFTIREETIVVVMWSSLPHYNINVCICETYVQLLVTGPETVGSLMYLFLFSYLTAESFHVG